MKTRTIRTIRRLNFDAIPMRQYSDDLFMANWRIADAKTPLKFAYAIWSLSYLGTGVIVKIK
jgi:hypothetical protein